MRVGVVLGTAHFHRGAFGDRVAKAFNQEWQKQGGQTVLRQDIGSAGELRQMVNSGGIRMTGTPMSSAPAPQSVTIAGLTIPAPPSDVPAATGGHCGSRKRQGGDGGDCELADHWLAFSHSAGWLLAP